LLEYKIIERGVFSEDGIEMASTAQPLLQNGMESDPVVAASSFPPPPPVNDLPPPPPPLPQSSSSSSSAAAAGANAPVTVTVESGGAFYDVLITKRLQGGNRKEKGRKRTRRHRNKKLRKTHRRSK
jgi:alkanesulfonate monooxygenase SsuD/methylene tetrahydromethanopterin reductase-like flavin-dependent oxidoreductase (luciferase family)